MYEIIDLKWRRPYRVFLTLIIIHLVSNNVDKSLVIGDQVRLVNPVFNEVESMIYLSEVKLLKYSVVIVWLNHAAAILPLLLTILYEGFVVEQAIHPL